MRAEGPCTVGAADAASSARCFFQDEDAKEGGAEGESEDGEASNSDSDYSSSEGSSLADESEDEEADDSDFDEEEEEGLSWDELEERAKKGESPNLVLRLRGFPLREGDAPLRELRERLRCCAFQRIERGAGTTTRKKTNAGRRRSESEDRPSSAKDCLRILPLTASRQGRAQRRRLQSRSFFRTVKPGSSRSRPLSGLTLAKFAHSPDICCSATTSPVLLGVAASFTRLARTRRNPTTFRRKKLKSLSARSIGGGANRSGGQAESILTGRSLMQ